MLLNAYGAWSYLRKEMEPTSFRTKYGGYGDFDLQEWKLSRPYDKSDYGEPVEVWNLEEPVDVGSYTELIPDKGYHYFEDRDIAVFFRDATRKDTLLLCPIKERLKGPPLSAKDILVYSNDDYLAVFGSISDYGDTQSLSFSSGAVSLFKKPGK